MWAPTGEYLLGKKFQHRNVLKNSIGQLFWKEIDTNFPKEYGIRALWTGIQRFNETHFSGWVLHVSNKERLRLKIENDLYHIDYM